MSEDVAGVVVTHEATADLALCIEALAPQVKELVIVANLPIELPPLPDHARVIRNESPHGFAANANVGFEATAASWIVLANPDTRPAATAVETLRRFAASRPRAGVLGPELRGIDGGWQPSRRAFPTVSGTLVRRTPLRRLLKPRERQRKHYLLDERPDGPAGADWLIGAFLLLRREMIDELDGFDAGYRLYGEDIDLCYRAMRAGWERWLVPSAVVTHRHAAVTDRRFFTQRTLWHWRSILRFVRKHPERLRALR
ncbi:MAG: glycosyltransferase [Gaiellaceae bacterium]